MRADQACICCHATAGMAVNGRPVYNGIGPALINNTGGLFNTGHFTGPNCTECHTNVHGAGADQTVASLNGYLLKIMTATNVQRHGCHHEQHDRCDHHHRQRQSTRVGSPARRSPAHPATTQAPTPPRCVSRPSASSAPSATTGLLCRRRSRRGRQRLRLCDRLHRPPHRRRGDHLMERRPAPSLQARSRTCRSRSLRRRTARAATTRRTTTATSPSRTRGARTQPATTPRCGSRCRQRG